MRGTPHVAALDRAQRAAASRALVGLLITPAHLTYPAAPHMRGTPHVAALDRAQRASLLSLPAHSWDC